MKTEGIILKHTSAIMLMFLMMTTGSLMAQEKTDLQDFKILLERTSKGIKMKSAQGSAWIDLSFSLKQNVPQAIDEYGMTDLNKVTSQKDENLADFLFTVTKTKDGLELKGLQGTAWTDLSFTLNNRNQQAIDAYGMTTWD